MLTEEVLNGNKLYDIPKDTIDNEIQTLMENLQAKKGFNPYQDFDPEKHLLYKDGDYEKVRTLTLNELGINKTHVPPISEVAVSDPFPLFTEEACEIMKWEAFQRKSVTKYGKLPIMSKGGTSTDVQVCGYTDYAPFTVAAWKHPKTQAIIDKFAGVELQIMFDYEIAHINASLIDQSKPRGKIAPSKSGKDKDSKAVFDWHYDSNSFSVVLMLSTNDEMEGGKTGLRAGNEEVVFVDGPKVGYATILQGRVVKHIATKPVSNDERISSIVGYIPKSLHVPDTTVLTTFRPSVSPRSLHDEYYPQWMEYRFKRIEARLADKRQEIMRNLKDGKRFDQLEVVEFCKDISQYLFKSWNEFESVVENEIFPPKVFSTPYNEL
ncbi:uncharacterized protein PRCAT00004232001 [Priceomyces carsonii]|uniref:uncharacterized protein n=1 Tax=Priceomyces carsonii TaxID=28549 RepID=UPI002ED98654|nr:unnamed protein product [Priceomyces carsonii]